MKYILCIFSFIMIVPSLPGQTGAYLIDQLMAEGYLTQEEVYLVDQHHLARSIYNLKTDQHKWTRHSKRRRYFAGAELTEKAKDLIDLLLRERVIDRSTYQDMEQRFWKQDAEDEHREMIIDALSVWQYLSEKDQLEASFSQDSIENYLRQLREARLITKETDHHEKISTKKDIISLLDRCLILENIDRFPDVDAFNKAVNKPELLENLGLINDYDPVLPSQQLFTYYYNQKLQEKRSPYRLILLTDTWEDNYLAILSVTEAQFHWIDSRSTYYEYPYFNPKWMKIGTLATNPFDDKE
ncbi:MAG: hypothetical protein R2824_27010 [Saprospiraceae bacterium]